MANPIDAKTVCDPETLKELEELANINKLIKELEGRKQPLVALIKQFMTGRNIESLILDGNVYTVYNSSRRIVSKATRDEFISSLISSGKKYLIHTSIEPDLDGILAEVDAGTIERSFVDKYITVVPITTLRCT